jgi:hemerythrin
MQKFVLDESLTTGVKMIDAHHKELIITINDLGEAIENGQGSTAIKKLLVFLQYYAEWHFEHEEKCAAKHKCPMAETNQQAHKQFLESLSQYKEEYRQNGANDDIALRIYQELSNWLVRHIQKIDTQVGHCLIKAGATT